MSKYIRIDNGVYKVGIDKEAKENGVSNYYYYIEVDKGVRLTFDEEELNKGRLGDTIEELCDELIIDTPSCRHQMSTNYIFDDMSYNPYEELKMLREQGIEYALYGAIWTDKGLIYVAKMNKKGELELI